MSDLTRIIRGDKTGLLRIMVSILRDFVIMQLNGGHAPEEREQLISRVDALKTAVDSDGDGIPDADDPTPHGDEPAAPPSVPRGYY